MRTRKYSDQLKGDCIEKYVGLGMTSTEISKEMNVPGEMVLRWVELYHKGKCQVLPGHSRIIEIIVK